MASRGRASDDAGSPGRARAYAGARGRRNSTSGWTRCTSRSSGWSERSESLAPWTNLALDLPDADGPDPLPPPAVAADWRALRARMFADTAIEDLPQHAADLIGDARTLATRLAEGDVPAAHAAVGRPALDDLIAAAEVAGRHAATLLEQMRELARQARESVQQMDFRFLYDRRRRLFRIGHNLTTGEPDQNHYDLLASEARVASYIAIAKRDVPVEHWLHLGRPCTRMYGAPVLLSWSATMFEYLMPTLLMRHPDDTLLAQSCRIAVRRQVAYGRRRSRLWGISESGFYAFDQERNYQYRAFGVPGLGFRRDLAEDLVFAPYASLLALPLEPRCVIANLDRLDQFGMLGRYGYFEAVDCTAARFHHEQPFEIVRSYMAHHQGMILTAIVNALSGGAMVERFHRDPNVETAEHLLWEHVPRGAPRAHVPPALPGRPVAASRPARAQPWLAPARGEAPDLMLLSNGRMSTLVSSAGTGASWWRGRALTRADADPTIQSGGTAIYVRDEDEGTLRSASLQPCGSWPAAGEVVVRAAQGGVPPPRRRHLPAHRGGRRAGGGRRDPACAHQQRDGSRAPSHRLQLRGGRPGPTGGGQPAPGLQQALRRSGGPRTRRAR